MSSKQRPTAASQTRPAIAAAIALVGAALGASIMLPNESPPPAASSTPDQTAARDRSSPPPPSAPPLAEDGGRQAAGAAASNGLTVFEREDPAVARLDPRLRRALREAAREAERDGVSFVVNSGWRSRKHQTRLLREAVAKYGSEEEAARWVATADTSPHVSGDAIDIAPASAISWLSQNGARYGLCQIYRNEPWHYELRPRAAGKGCPAMYPDPTHDPRMQK